MPKVESLVDARALARLAKTFDTHGSDLETYTKEFRAKTDAEVIDKGFGVLTESEEVTSAYIEMSTDMVETLNALRQHLDHISQGLRTVQQNATGTDESLAAGFSHGGGA
ncbi:MULTISPECIES: hypothetical protein [Streptomyces]|uniref:hypothetical protein n=1 Tax=Streptomyces TaxID=1883 RepID=UPI0019663E74|nr:MULTISPECIES: hypothetical protein [Streptomyces]QRX90441.1 hypothetical protein JNO44_05920 [Streptomyces noursei]UJB40354.1 hypothetical protein HRD51_05365 [Streptomyces sp. A1-5]